MTYKQLSIRVALILFFMGLITVPFFVFGQVGTGGGGPLELPNPLEVQSIPELIAEVFRNITIFVAPPIAAVMIIVGAFQMLTAGGNPEKFDRGKKTVFYTVVGLIVVLLGSVIAELIAEILGAP